MAEHHPAHCVRELVVGELKLDGCGQEMLGSTLLANFEDTSVCSGLSWTEGLVLCQTFIFRVSQGCLISGRTLYGLCAVSASSGCNMSSCVEGVGWGLSLGQERLKSTGVVSQATGQ